MDKNKFASVGAEQDKKPIEESRLEYRKNTMYEKYLPGQKKLSAKEKFLGLFTINTLTAATLFLFGNTWWVLAQSYKYEEGGYNRNPYYKPYKEALYDAYVPVNDYYNNDNKLEFAPQTAWFMNVFLSLCMLLITVLAVKKNYDFDAVDMMVELEYFGKQHNLNTRQVRNLAKVAQDIIKKMSADKRVYFDMLAKGDINIKDRNTMANIATAIIKGHLQTHPEDMNLVSAILREKNIIPRDNLTSINQKTR